MSAGGGADAEPLLQRGDPRAGDVQAVTIEASELPDAVDAPRVGAPAIGGREPGEDLDARRRKSLVGVLPLELGDGLGHQPSAFDGRVHIDVAGGIRGGAQRMAQVMERGDLGLRSRALNSLIEDPTICGKLSDSE